MTCFIIRAEVSEINFHTLPFEKSSQFDWTKGIYRIILKQPYKKKFSITNYCSIETNCVLIIQNKYKQFVFLILDIKVKFYIFWHA